MSVKNEARLMLELDQFVPKVSRQYLSLNPGKNQPTAFSDLFETWLGAKPKNWLVPVANSLDVYIRSICKAFPGNIFWDFDVYFCFLSRFENLEDALCNIKLATELQLLYGEKGKVNFQFAHDFLYGFDWARWMKKNKHEGKLNEFHPFDITFLNYLKSRHQELLDLIAKDDDKYHKLPGGEFRNPFQFKRDPESEKETLKRLVLTDSIPCKAWLSDGGKLDWVQDYEASRREVAHG